jgi:hypothetical protein
MTKCIDGRKHVIVSAYKKKTGTNVSRYERSCPSKSSNASEDRFICCLCGEEHGLGDLHDVQIKNETKTICNECVDIIHGLM